MLSKFKKELQETGKATLRIKVKTGAKETAATEILKEDNQEITKIDLKALPQKGRANGELVRFLAKKLGVSQADIKIISGSASKLKLIKIKKV